MMPKAPKPNENITTGGDSLIYGENCNVEKHCAGHHCPLGQGQGTAVHQWLCELLSGLDECCTVSKTVCSRLLNCGLTMTSTLM